MDRTGGYRDGADHCGDGVVMTDLSELEALVGRATPGPWRATAMGGHSTVLTEAKPKRNDTRVPPYAYREEHCIAYPFVDENGRDFRWDFVCFSHDDARLIAAAVTALPHLISTIRSQEAASVELRAENERVKGEALHLEAQVEELRNEPWPQWVTDCLKLIRDESGYDGYDDEDGVDLPEELSELINELRDQADKNVAEARASRKLDEAERTAEHYREQAKGYRDETAGIRAALVEARGALGNLLADIDSSSTFEGWSEGHKPLADKLDYDVLKAARAIAAQEKPHE